MSYKYGGEAKRQKKDISAKKTLIQQRRMVILHPERMKIHPKETQPSGLQYSLLLFQLRQHFSGWGQKKLFFSRRCIFHGYFLFNLAPRGPQLATKMAPAFLWLAGALFRYNKFCCQGHSQMGKNFPLLFTY